jgi:tetratricopeptide (TPR) repeat protein
LAAPDPHDAALAFEESISLCRLLENDFGLALSQHWMSQMYFALGRLPEAVEAARTASRVRRDMGDWRGLVHALVDLAAYRLTLGTVAEVAKPLREALDVVRRTEHALGLAMIAQGTAALALARGEATVAARLTGFSDARLRTLGIERERVGTAQREALAADLAEGLGADRARLLVSEGEWLKATAADAEIAAVLAVG